MVIMSMETYEGAMNLANDMNLIFKELSEQFKIYPICNGTFLPYKGHRKCVINN